MSEIPSTAFTPFVKFETRTAVASGPHALGVSKTPKVADQPHNARTLAHKKAELQIDPNRWMDRLRVWDAKNPIASKVAAVASIAVISAAGGAILGFTVDQLAHLTSRKNDAVGKVFGTVIGLLFGISHTVMLFGLPKKFEMRYRFGDFHPDSKSSFGQARQFMENSALPLYMAFIRNAKSNLGIQHDHILVTEADIRSAINHIQRWGIPKSVWEK